MGLDMYLNGETYYSWGHPNYTARPYPIKTTTFELGYWRKHPNLHGYIVQTFANGEDDCGSISLCEERLETLIKAIEEGGLPHTEGFFFGASDCTPEERAEDLKIIKGALSWLRTDEKNCYKSVSYQASW